jgi:hypothetical protein
MALIIYPELGYDSLISEANATEIIVLNNINSAKWLTLSIEQREVYLRIATNKVLGVVSYDITNLNGYLDSLSYVASESCLPTTCALMAVHDLLYGISSEINPNTGLITKEKVGDIEVSYTHGNPTRQIKGRVSSPFPSTVIPCLNSYGAAINTASGITQSTLVRS